MLETRKVDNNKKRKAPFVNLRPLDMQQICVRPTYTVSQKSSHSL